MLLSGPERTSAHERQGSMVLPHLMLLAGPCSCASGVPGLQCAYASLIPLQEVQSRQAAPPDATWYG